MLLRLAFTLVEAVVAGAIFLMIAGVLIYAFVNSRKVEESVSLHVGLLENVTLALHAIRSDLRLLCIVPDKSKALDRYSFAIFDVDHGIILKVASSEPVDPLVVGSHYTLVAYHLVAADHGVDRFHLVRTEFTQSGRKLPGRSVARETKVFRAFTVRKANTSFLYWPPSGGLETHILHVALDVVSDTGSSNTGEAFKEKGLIVTNVIRLVRPEEPFDSTNFTTGPLAQPVLSPPVPPGQILAPVAKVVEIDPAKYGL